MDKPNQESAEPDGQLWLWDAERGMWVLWAADDFADTVPAVYESEQ